MLFNPDVVIEIIKLKICHIDFILCKYFYVEKVK